MRCSTGRWVSGPWCTGRAPAGWSLPGTGAGLGLDAGSGNGVVGFRLRWARAGAGGAGPVPVGDQPCGPRGGSSCREIVGYLDAGAEAHLVRGLA